MDASTLIRSPYVAIFPAMWYFESPRYEMKRAIADHAREKWLSRQNGVSLTGAAKARVEMLDPTVVFGPSKLTDVACVLPAANPYLSRVERGHSHLDELLEMETQTRVAVVPKRLAGCSLADYYLDATCSKTWKDGLDMEFKDPEEIARDVDALLDYVRSKKTQYRKVEEEEVHVLVNETTAFDDSEVFVKTEQVEDEPVAYCSDELFDSIKEEALDMEDLLMNNCY